MTALPTIRQLLDDASERLGPVSDTARLDAELLLARAIDMPRSFLFAHPDDELDAAAVKRLEATLQRRLAGEPLAYIRGEKEFWSLPLMVSPATLVPRADTEVLVEQALGQIPRRAALRVLDLGTGSGAIALALAHDRPLCEVTATDISGAALAVAEQNARQIGLPNIEFLQGSWAAPVRGRQFDVIVSNPPYVADEDPALASLAHEPRAALAAGPDGLDAIRVLASECRGLLDDDGVLLLEHGSDQQAPVAAILQANGWADVRCVNDYAGLPRVTIARRGTT